MSKPVFEEPYTVPNKGPIPRIEREEDLPPGGLNIAWIDSKRKNDYHWSRGLPWHDRLHAHATMSSARRNAQCRRPFEPKNELDFVLDAAYCPMIDAFSEKTDPYLQVETVLGENMNLDIEKRRFESSNKPKPTSGRFLKFQLEPQPEKETWRVLRNRIVIYPERSVLFGYDIVHSNGGVQRRENIHNVKLGIAAYHSPQTNPGFSRTPSGAFYSV